LLKQLLSGTTVLTPSAGPTCKHCTTSRSAACSGCRSVACEPPQRHPDDDQNVRDVLHLENDQTLTPCHTNRAWLLFSVPVDILRILIFANLYHRLFFCSSLSHFSIVSTTSLQKINVPLFLQKRMYRIFNLALECVCLLYQKCILPSAGVN
jgi:hypothetical protein